MNVGWVGVGKLGLPCALTLADAGHVVSLFDVSPRYLEILAGDVDPPQEAGIGDLIRRVASEVRGCKSIGHVVERSDVIFVAVQTPHSPEYGGHTEAPSERRDFDYTALTGAVREVCAEALAQEKHVTVVVVSTALPGSFNRHLRPLANRFVTLTYGPAFIAMGTTIADYTNPEFVLLGADDPQDLVPVKNVYRHLHDRPFAVMSIESAELCKVAYNCYSDDTEVMTSDGWRLFADLTGDEQVLSLNPDTHVAEWSDHTPAPPNDTYTEMIHFWSSKDDILVTPGHNMYAASLRRGPGPLPCDSDTYSYKFDLIPAEQLEDRKTFSFTRTARWLGEYVPEVTLVSHRFPIETYARFMAWWLAEGCVTQNSAQSWSVMVSQSRTANPDKWVECQKVIDEVCTILGVSFYEHQNGFTFYHKHLGMYLSNFGNSFSKFVPDLLKESPPDVIRVFLEVYMDADGCDGRKSGNQIYYATSSEQMADDLGEMLVKVGHMPSYRTHHSPKSGRRNFLIYQTTSKTSTRRHVDRVPYSGKVYCTTLDKNHIMLTRRNGKCTWQGNTFISQKIVFGNTLMEICHKTGADCDEVVDGLTLATQRVTSSAYMRGGMGDGGACHPRDLIAMSWLAERLDLSTDLMGYLVEAREDQSRWLRDLVWHYSELYGLPTVVLGAAYKPESDLVAGSPALLLAEQLGDEPQIWDPHVAEYAEPPGAVPHVYVVATRHECWLKTPFPIGSVVLDPFGYIPDQPGVTVVRIGRKT